MKGTILFIIIFFFLTKGIISQESLSKLRPPSSPASSVLGLQPNVVLSPKSFNELETALYSNFFNNEGSAVIPNDFAIEVTPYWMWDHGLSLEEYLFPGEEQLIRNFAFSLASTQNFILVDSSKTPSLGIGLRNSFHIPNTSDKLKIKNLDDFLGKKQDISSDIILDAKNIIKRTINKEEFKKAIDSTIENSTNENIISLSKELIKIISGVINRLPDFGEKNKDDFIKEFDHQFKSALEFDKIISTFKNYIQKRDGLIFDIALAALINFPTSNFTFSVMPHYSLWITPTYRLGSLLISIVYRHEWYDNDYYKKYFPNAKYYQNNSDYGFAISGEFEKISILFELAERSSSSEIIVGESIEGKPIYTKDESSDLQYIGSFSYNLSDEIVLTYSIGNRFKPEIIPTNTLLSLLSLNFGFGSPTVEKDLK